MREYTEPLSFPDFEGGVRRDFRDPLLLKALAEGERLLDRPEAEVLQSGRNRLAVVPIMLSSGQAVTAVVKEFRVRGVDRLKTLLLPSKAFKAWRGAWALVEKGIETPPPIAYLEKRGRGFVDRCFFLAEYVQGLEEVRGLFRRLHGRELEELLEALAHFLAGCHDRGILHRDLSDGNVLRKEKKNGMTFFLLDTNRVRLRKRLGPHRRMANLIRLGVPKDVREDFIARYWGGRIPRRSLWLWYKLCKARYTGLVELKKKLKLRHLARKLGIQ